MTSSQPAAFRRLPLPLRTLAWGICILAAAVAVSGFLYYKTRDYAIERAEGEIAQLMAYHKAVHLYIQRDVHPALYKLKAAGEMAQDFYSPEFLSSSYIARNTHAYLNEIREAQGEHKLYYKMAAINPRNPANAPDALEQRLIEVFDADRAKKKHREIMEIDGQKYLYYALPFLDTNEACLRCHGDPADAPVQLVRRYGDTAGFHAKPKGIRAIESIRAPIERELKAAQIGFIATVCVGLAVVALVLINRRLRAIVRARTRNLEEEIGERERVEKALRHSEMRLQSQNRELELQVTERDRAEEQLRRHMAELEQFNALAIGREERMIELKREINTMAQAAGLDPPYDLRFADIEAATAGVGVAASSCKADEGATVSEAFTGSGGCTDR